MGSNLASAKKVQHVLVGGVNSPVRAFRHVQAPFVILAHGAGVSVQDPAGHTWIDFISGWGALILGHVHPVVLRTMRSALSRNWPLGLSSPYEVELARLMIEAVPTLQRVRFTVSGTEACMIAIRLARAATGRSKILVFQGAYHGHSDSLMAASTKGIPESLGDELLRLPYQDLQAAEQAIQQQADSIAAVIIEPVAANMGVIVPQIEFLQNLRRLTTAHGILLIFDEVVTGFRLGLGGAQERFGVLPDLTTFGKIIGGGLPIGAVGGSEQIMTLLAPEGNVFHGGTFAGHPLVMQTGMATLKELKRHPPYRRLERLGAQLEQGLLLQANRSGVPIQINRIGSMLTVFFSNRPVRNEEEVLLCNRVRFARWANVLREQGILIPPSPFEAIFLSAKHSESDIKKFIVASAHAFDAAGKA